VSGYELNAEQQQQLLDGVRMLKASCKKRSVSSAYMRAPAPKVPRISEQIQIVDSMQDSDTEDAQSE
jgi:hypothetical protein